MTAPTPGARLGRTVVALGVVSFFTDVAADMVVPFLPIFLTRELHAATTFVGLVEGLAEGTAAFTKYLTGRASDRLPRKKPLVAVGYGVANLVRPLLAFAAAPWHVLAVRFIDRIGKGIRTSPRDALIAQSTAPERHGAAFGFHRGMDNLGAVFGPLLASLILWWSPGNLRAVFAFTLVPGVLSLVALVFGVREPAAPALASTVSEKAPLAPLPGRFRSWLGWVAVFTLANASDGFLLLRARDLGAPEAILPLAWGALSLLRALAATPGGHLADRMGRGRALALGWGLYALTYLGFALATGPRALVPLVVVYGLYYGLTEGTERALVASFVDKGSLGRAYGTFNLVVGATALPASLLFGRLYPYGKGALACAVCAALAAIAAAGMTVWNRSGEPA